jgi:hypothetical protein
VTQRVIRAGELGFEPRIATSKGWSPTIRRLPKIKNYKLGG